uniref:SRA1 domain-containing protein n=1 Tax=Syphacia muris TaxID=451379 RepID=A0A158R3V1_9BILA
MKSETEELFVIPQNSGLRPAAPPPEFQGGFGSGSGGSSFGSKPETFQSGPSFGNSNGVAESITDDNNVDSSFFTGESALTPNNRGPTGDGYGPPLYPGAAIPPPVPAVNVGGSAAGIPPPYQVVDATQNPPTTLKPSALFNVLSKADLGFNQAMTHFERGTPVESAAIDILEVALGSQKLDSQARLLGHVDRAIGIGNLQRLQRWANTGGALDSLKEQLARFLKNFSPPEHLLPTIPPQLSHLFSSSK